MDNSNLTVGQFFKVSGERMRVLVGCGAAAGLAAIFNAPIAGVLFSLEVILGEFNLHSFSPIVISSVVATAVSRAWLIHGAAIKLPPYMLFSYWEIFFYAILGVAAGIVSVWFTKSLHGMEAFRKIRSGQDSLATHTGRSGSGSYRLLLSSDSRLFV